MSVLHTILEVQHTEAFRVTCLWNTGEVRVNDFKGYLRGKNQRLHGLKDPIAFQSVKAVDGALQWPDILVPGLHKGKIVDQPLTLAPEVLYEESKYKETSLMVSLSFKLKQARLKAGLTQTKLATLSGTTKEYISRLESGKSDFQVSTYDRIVQKGLNLHSPEVLLK